MQTIAAISTPAGKGGIAVIRISGDDAVGVAGRIFTCASGKDVSALPARYAAFGTIHTISGEVLDTGLCTLFRENSSYTGEDTAEISCHGGTYVTKAVLSAALSAGARMAEAGEFTRRAFLAGKLSLTEAEGVGQLIDADTEERMKLSATAVRGTVSEKIRTIREPLFDVMTALYAAMDYPEEDVGDEGEEQIGAVVDTVLHEVRGLLATYKTGRAVAEGVKTVICGRPNAGKSSLFNRLTGEETAIVTRIEGTTRDILRQTVSFGGVTLRLSDTAGLRETEDPVEMLGVGRANAEIREAELVLSVFDPAAGLGEAEREMMTRYPDCPRIAVLNKADEGAVFGEGDIALLQEYHECLLPVSCITGEGMDALSAEVARLWGSDRLELGRDAVIWDVRHRAALERAERYLTDAGEALLVGDALDAVCTLCESALAALDETDGRTVNGEIVDAIFARFCVGK